MQYCDTPQGALSGTAADMGGGRTLGVDTGGDIVPGHDMGVVIGDVMTLGVDTGRDIVPGHEPGVDIGDVMTLGVDTGGDIVPSHEPGVVIDDIMTLAVDTGGDIAACRDIYVGVTLDVDVDSELLSGRRFLTSSPGQPDEPRLVLKIQYVK